MTRVAAVDCGTNSLRLLIADDDGGGGLTEWVRRTEIVRLGQGVDATGEFHPDALARTFAVTDDYAQLVRDAGVPTERIHFVATSASRDARNREEFFAGIEQRLGVRPDIISGEREAQLSYAGAVSGVGVVPGRALLTDVGGGSTELVQGHGEAGIERAVSLDVGSVRVTERFLRGSPPDPAGRVDAEAYVDRLLAGSGVDFASVGTWIGVAGTVTTLAAAFLGLERYDRAKVHGARLPTEQLPGLLDWLAGMTVEEIRAIPSMHPGRADVITGGALVVTRVARLVGADTLTVSESDILDGIALALLRP